MNDQPRTPETERPVTPLRAALNQYRGGFMAIAGFSALVNILMLVSPMYMLQMYDRVLTSFSPQTLIMLTLIAFFLLGCFGLLEWVRQRLMQRIGLALGLNMAEDVLTSAFRSSLANQAQGATQPVRDLDSIRQFMGSPTIFAFFDIPWTPIFTAVIFMFHPLMGAVAVFGALVILTLGLLAEFRSRMPMRAAAMEGLQSHQLLESSMRNSDSLKAMGMFEGLMGRWQGQHRRSASFQSSAAGRLSVLLATTKAFRFSVQVGILGTGAYLVLQQEVTPGMMIAGSIIMSRALQPIEQGITAWRGFVGARQSWRRINGLLQNFGDADAASGPDLPRPEGKVEAENLSIVPPGGETPVVREVNFKLEAGTLTGLIGPSGSGKSSLASVMMGVWPAAEGALRLDGAEIGGWPDHLRLKHFGYLPQQVELFDGTVAENICRLEEPEAEAIITAAQMAGCHEVIMRLPNNYATPIGIGGRGLSAGQRQRVALARAVYGDPAFVVLDEPDSNLDSEGQEALGAVLDKLRERRITTVLITHNVRLLRRVDQIGVMNEGQLVSFGPRDQIMGQFAKPRAQQGAAVAGAPPATAAGAQGGQPGATAAPAKPIQVKYKQ
ncbi:MAG: type I secretion system permease/ATPase [Gammaproteobacteria bacterium]|nr:type I secretion system permease/ATPase [Gammaproteobacteria bacterium]